MITYEIVAHFRQTIDQVCALSKYSYSPDLSEVFSANHASVVELILAADRSYIEILDLQSPWPVSGPIASEHGSDDRLYGVMSRDLHIRP